MAKVNRPHFVIEIKQVGNGFFLSVTNQSSYEKSESVHVTMREVHDAIDKVIGFVKDSFVALPPPLADTPVNFQEEGIPF